MQATRRVQINGAAGFALLCVCLLGVRWPSRPPPPAALVPRGSLPPPRTPSESALREAKQWQLYALDDAFEKLEILEAWDPRSTTGAAWRLQVNSLLADDRRGCLSRARASAQQAVTLARSTEEIYWATRRLATVECLRGDHRTELRHARRLMALQPHREDSLGALAHAARCNGLASLERQMEAAMNAHYAAMEAARADQRFPYPAGPGRGALTGRNTDRQ
jgi:hypothetical protein